MSLKKPFLQEIRLNFLYVYWCFDCNRSDRGLELHHVRARISNTMLDAIPLCKWCHSKVGHTAEEEHRYRELVIAFYIRENIKVPQKDIEYLKDIDYPQFTKYAGVL